LALTDRAPRPMDKRNPASLTGRAGGGDSAGAGPACGTLWRAKRLAPPHAFRVLALSHHLRKPSALHADGVGADRVGGGFRGGPRDPVPRDEPVAVDE